MKVENGEEFYGSKDLVDDDGYFTIIGLIETMLLQV